MQIQMRVDTARYRTTGFYDDRHRNQKATATARRTTSMITAGPMTMAFTLRIVGVFELVRLGRPRSLNSSHGWARPGTRRLPGVGSELLARPRVVDGYVRRVAAVGHRGFVCQGVLGMAGGRRRGALCVIRVLDEARVVGASTFPGWARQGARRDTDRWDTDRDVGPATSRHAGGRVSVSRRSAEAGTRRFPAGRGASFWLASPSSRGRWDETSWPI